MSPASSPRPERHYPAIWERAIPIAVVIIGILILVVLGFVLATALGAVPGSR